MQQIVRAVLKYGIDKVRRNRLVQDVFESPFDLSGYTQMGSFTDRHGNKHLLYEGLRTKIAPGWVAVATGHHLTMVERNIARRKSEARVDVAKLRNALKMVDKSIHGSDVLEVGCHSGAASYALAEQGARSVIGSEFTGYKISAISADGTSDTKKMEEIDSRLHAQRQDFRAAFPESPEVTFVNDDICNSSLPDASVDIICSWEVLEHLSDPGSAFTHMARILRPGGVAVHRYNPFFCLNGGHSLCTLDFLWGHVRLDEQDFTDYVRRLRPNELEKATSFYRHGLNRMTLSDIKVFHDATGMKIIGITPFAKEQHLRMVDMEILAQAKANYPELELMDLIAPSVLVIVQKP